MINFVSKRKPTYMSGTPLSILLSFLPQLPESVQTVFRTLTLKPISGIDRLLCMTLMGHRRVSCNHLISNELEWINYFNKNALKISIILPEFICKNNRFSNQGLSALDIKKVIVLVRQILSLKP